MKKICVFTGTRAEYGLLYWLMKDIEKHQELELQIIVSGSHLSPEFGLTYQQIESDGFYINDKVEMLLSSKSAVGTAKSIGLGVLGFADALAKLAPDYLVILGDRYEALAIAQTAMILRIPIAHLNGGEVTEGAYDDAIRHAITKLSYLHFTANDGYSKRVIQLGEEPSRVFNVGSIGLEHLKRTDLLSINALSKSIGLDLEDNKFFLVTYHSVTLSDDELPQETFRNLTQALDDFNDYKVILTYPNADDGGREIIQLLDNYVVNNKDRVVGIQSLGQIRYLSAVKFASVVIGNSSSGIAEVPSFATPTINIGGRQKGRLMAKSIIHAKPSYEAINKAIKISLSDNNYIKGTPVINPYGDGATSKKIIEKLLAITARKTKTFFDL
jgi:UDP-N-acetylglucosamine 2-epimerase (non-hydrolysing)